MVVPLVRGAAPWPSLEVGRIDAAVDAAVPVPVEVAAAAARITLDTRDDTARGIGAMSTSAPSMSPAPPPLDPDPDPAPEPLPLPEPDTTNDDEDDEEDDAGATHINVALCCAQAGQHKRPQRPQCSAKRDPRTALVPNGRLHTMQFTRNLCARSARSSAGGRITAPSSATAMPCGTKSSGLWSWSWFVRNNGAPARTSSTAISLKFSWHAQCSAVFPVVSCVSNSVPARTSTSTVRKSALAFLHKTISGVSFKLDVRFGSNPPRSSNTDTASARVCEADASPDAAACRGVRRSASRGNHDPTGSVSLLDDAGVEISLDGVDVGAGTTLNAGGGGGELRGDGAVTEEDDASDVAPGDCP